MATITGNTGSISFDGNLVSELTSFTINQTAETVDDTAKGDTWRTKKPTLKSWSLEFGFRYDPTDSGQGGVAVGAVGAFIGYVTENTPGAYKFDGSCIITEKSFTSELENIVEGTATAEGTGALVESVIA